MVAGGGPVGAALGLMLKGTVVLEAGRYPRDKACGEGLLPSGSRVLREAGVDLGREGFPSISGVRYRIPGGDSCRASFRSGRGFGVRRTRFDALLAERAGVCSGVRVTGARAEPGRVVVETTEGTLSAAALVVADGLRSPLARQLGWWRGSRGASRFGLVGHLAWEHNQEDIEVTLLGGLETYLAPVGRGELLLAVLGGRQALRATVGGTESRYREVVLQAHPEMADAPLLGRLRGAGPFSLRPRRVAQGRIFLAGDAAGFCDPLTGDAISAGLGQARELARLLDGDPGSAAASYQSFCDAQWRRRRAVGALARRLSGSPRLARRAVRGLARRPGALQALLEVNEGSRGFGALGPWDWAALAGLARP